MLPSMKITASMDVPIVVILWLIYFVVNYLRHEGSLQLLLEDNIVCVGGGRI